MPDISSSFEKFISGKTVKSAPMTLTIIDVKEVEITKEGEPAEKKWTLFFEEDQRGLVVNKGRFKDLSHFFGSNTDEWIGHRIKLTFDPSIKFRGEYVGGIALSKAD